MARLYERFNVSVSADESCFAFSPSVVSFGLQLAVRVEEDENSHVVRECAGKY